MQVLPSFHSLRATGTSLARHSFASLEARVTLLERDCLSEKLEQTTEEDEVAENYDSKNERVALFSCFSVTSVSSVVCSGSCSSLCLVQGSCSALATPWPASFRSLVRAE